MGDLCVRSLKFLKCDLQAPEFNPVILETKNMLKKPMITILSKRTITSSNVLFRAGSINKAGGKFAEHEKAREDEYFYKIQREQLKNLKKSKPDPKLQLELDEVEAELLKLREEFNQKKTQLQELQKEN